MNYLLHLDFSGRRHGSSSRAASAAAAEKIATELGADIRYHDLSQGLPFVDDTMVEGYFTPEEQRTDAHREALKVSDAIVHELQGANALVIGTPIYNFGPPASLKAWADQVARMGVTVQYVDGNPVGQLPNVPTKVYMAYGGTEIGNKRDFLTPWLTMFLNYVGISNIEYFPAVADES
jgi:FMN-dependent NADH-azoreductase